MQSAREALKAKLKSDPSFRKELRKRVTDALIAKGREEGPRTAEYNFDSYMLTGVCLCGGGIAGRVGEGVSSRGCYRLACNPTCSSMQQSNRTCWGAGFWFLPPGVVYAPLPAHPFPATPPLPRCLPPPPSLSFLPVRC